MNNKMSRSSLKKVAPDEGDPVRPPRRRISFSGKKFIREFDTTEKARDYDNSYEISDHTTGDDSSGQSHCVTAASSTLHVATRISLENEMNKENAPLTSVRESISTEYDQQCRSDFTLQLQTSINVTLMPHELAKNRQRMELSVPLESMAFDSLSLSDVERHNLQKNSMFEIPVNDKTMDLVPHKMVYDAMHPASPEKENAQKTISIPTDINFMSPKERDLKQKTVLFENNDITCDVTGIDQQKVMVAATAEKTTYESFNIEEKDSPNYLQDDSTSSPLIPLDVISENGISRKLNFRQLNEALNSGRIQLFPNGPRTPTTDRRVKQQRFWHGLEPQPMEQDVPLKKAIKPRGTLNFNESISMSPIAQQSQPAKDNSDEPFRGENLANVKRNNRFSQADELMLDNTNFLAHAKMGDETQSRNSSKSTSRRETTYDNTAMELDDLEKQEAAVVAALEKATRRPTMQRMAALDKSDAINSTGQNNVHKASVDLQDKQRLSRTIQLDESMEAECLKQPAQERIKQRPTLHMEDTIDDNLAREKSVIPAVEQEYIIRRQTLHFTEAIDEDMASPRRDLHSNSSAPRVDQQTGRRRQTLHFTEDIDEEMPSPRQLNLLAPPVKEQTGRRRQTLHVSEPIEEDIVGQQVELMPKQGAASVEQQSTHRRQTIHFTDAINEDIDDPKDLHSNFIAPPVEKQTGRRRQTLHFEEAVEEDTLSPRKDSQSNCLAPLVEKQSYRRRQTVHMAEPIEEDVGKPPNDSKSKPTAPALEQKYNTRRQTLHFSEDIEEEMLRPQPESQWNADPAPAQKQSNRRRQTVHMAEPIEEDFIKPQKELKPQPANVSEEQQWKRHRQTHQMAERIEEDAEKPPKDLKAKPAAAATAQEYSIRRQTLLYSADIEEDFVRPQQELQWNPVAAPVEKQSNRRRQTVHMAEPIEEDLIRPEKELNRESAIVSEEQQRKRHRQTNQMAERIEEDAEKPPKDLKAKPAASAMAQEYSIRRQTLQFSEDIEEDFVRPQHELQMNCLAPVAAPVDKQSNRRRQTLHLNEPMEEEPVKFEEEARAGQIEQQSLRRRQTVLMPKSIEEDVVKPPNDVQTKPAVPAMVQEYSIRRQTLQFAADIEEDPVRHQQELPMNEVAAPLKQQSNRRRQTLHMVEFIEEDSFSSNNELMQTQSAAPIESRPKHQPTMYLEEGIDEELVVKTHTAPSSKQRQTVLKSEQIEEDLICHQMDTSSTAKSAQRASHSMKSRQTFHLSEPIEDEKCNALSMKKQDKRPRQTLILSEDIEAKESCFELGSVPTATSKHRQTVDMAVDIDDNLPAAPPASQQSNKSRMTFLESFDPEFLSPNTDKMIENTEMKSQSDSAEWMDKMNAMLRRTLINPIKDEVSKSVLNPLVANRPSMETPKSNKIHRGCFPITPGRSMIEYEDLEEMCNAESPVAAEAAASTYQPVDMELDMDISSYGTPIAHSKPSNLLNIKRLPIHLTPNLPQPKKRNTQLPVKQDDPNTSDEGRRDEEDLTLTSGNRYRIPDLCKTLNTNSPWQETEQLDGTVQMVRAQMMRQTRSLFETEALYPLDGQLKPEVAGTYEDNPITISDVSKHFAAQHELANAAVDPKNTSSNSRSSNENSNKSYVRAHKKFINLSGDTVIFDAAEVIDLAADDNEIDKTRLSLVSTLLDEEEDGVVNGSVIKCNAEAAVEIVLEPEPEPQHEPETCLEQRAVAGAVDACKKCNHCKRSIDGTLMHLSESFALPNWSALEQGLERLEQLRQQPNLDEVHKYWELKRLARYSNNSDKVNETTLDINDNEQRLTLQEMLEMFNKKFEECKKKLPEPVTVDPYVKRLDAKLRDQVPRWIFDYQLQCDRQYIISHRRITTFRIVINYEPLDIMETNIRVRNIKAMTATAIPKPYWLVYEHLMDFQVRLRLPLNLLNLLDGNDVDNMVKFLQHVDTICLETVKLCNDLHLVLVSNKARLLRKLNRTVVRKTVQKMIQVHDEAYMRVEKTNFVIEIGNVENISFKDILQPPLYQFDEKIQFLPKGIAFLDTFLQNPEQYLKPIVEPSS